ncbi:hypothetical protein PVAND_008857 [Polypedilum vanderplanki]|uniref:Uncharacterized protein n=1 Tax=Polypedilum vanderplanki TaxID=319348 RepID=A0A9J6CCD1_POLVA|nr:hypothetical protein PVAND_008857 [Polypedilum vanderplanki]
MERILKILFFFILILLTVCGMPFTDLNPSDIIDTGIGTLKFIKDGTKDVVEQGSETILKSISTANQVVLETGSFHTDQVLDNVGLGLKTAAGLLG